MPRSGPFLAALREVLLGFGTRLLGEPKPKARRRLGRITDPDQLQELSRELALSDFASWEQLLDTNGIP